MVFLVAQSVKNPHAMLETWVQSLGWEDLEKGMATHSSILAWRIPWTEEPGGLQFMGSQRVGQDWATNTHRHTKNKHKQEPCLECPRNRGEASTFVAEGGRRAKRDEDRFRAGPHAAPGRGKDSDFYFDWGQKTTEDDVTCLRRGLFSVSLKPIK